MSDPGKKPEDGGTLKELRALTRGEPIASFLNLKTLELSPGYARVSLKVLPEHMNFNKFIFGGIIAAVADQAFALGANSLVIPSIASQFNIHFINAPGIGDELIAESRVLKNGRRAGFSEITVTDQDGKLIAKATGTTIPISQVLPSSTSRKRN